MVACGTEAWRHGIWCYWLGHEFTVEGVKSNMRRGHENPMNSRLSLLSYQEYIIVLSSIRRREREREEGSVGTPLLRECIYLSVGVFGVLTCLDV